MSAEATGQVWRFSPYTGSQLLVHLAIADVVNDVHENEFWMSTAALASKAKVSRSTVTATLADMVKRGYLTVLHAGAATREPTRYQWVTSAISGATRPERSSPLARGAVSNTKETEVTESEASALSGHVDCPRCQGRGTYFSGAGIDVACSCIERPPHLALVEEA